MMAVYSPPLCLDFLVLILSETTEKMPSIFWQDANIGSRQMLVDEYLHNI